jgi:hypothetical protein
MNMEYLWVSKVLPDMNMLQLWKGIVISSVITSLPEILFAYYMMYVGYKNIVQKKASLLLSLLQALAVLLACIIAVRLLGFYGLKYYAYQGRLAEPVLWDITIMWRSLIYIGFSCGMALSLKLFRNQTAIANRERELIREKGNIELQLLRSQLHPHFLFNTLNNIYALTRKKSDEAPETVMKLSELLDFMLYRSNTDTIPILKEISFLEDYISLEKIRYSNKLSIEFLKDTGKSHASIAPFLLLPLVENAFKHGTGETRQNSFIAIEITEKNNQLHFMIQNNFDAGGGNADKEKLGLKNVKRRLELLYKEYSFHIKETAGNFKVDMFINLDSYGKA